MKIHRDQDQTEHPVPDGQNHRPRSKEGACHSSNGLPCSGVARVHAVQFCRRSSLALPAPMASIGPSMRDALAGLACWLRHKESQKDV